jgi:hypothetical protein
MIIISKSVAALNLEYLEAADQINRGSGKFWNFAKRYINDV